MGTKNRADTIFITLAAMSVFLIALEPKYFEINKYP
jgi:hypothetical protein